MARWGAFRKLAFYRRMLPGLNASAVGLVRDERGAGGAGTRAGPPPRPPTPSRHPTPSQVTAAAFTLTISLRKVSPFPDASLGIGMVAFTLTEVVKAPAPVAVVAGGVLGVVAWAAKMH